MSNWYRQYLPKCFCFLNWILLSRCLQATGQARQGCLFLDLRRFGTQGKFLVHESPTEVLWWVERVKGDLKRGLKLAHRVRVMAKDWMTVGWKLRILGYRSMGLRVPDVMITLWNLVKTGFIARLASRQLSCNISKRLLWGFYWGPRKRSFFPDVKEQMWDKEAVLVF